MKTLCDRDEPWFMPVAATTLFFAPVAMTEISCQHPHPQARKGTNTSTTHNSSQR